MPVTGMTVTVIRGTCAESEDATSLTLPSVSCNIGVAEALALIQRMQSILLKKPISDIFSGQSVYLSDIFSEQSIYPTVQSMRGTCAGSLPVTGIHDAMTIIVIALQRSGLE